MFVIIWFYCIFVSKILYNLTKLEEEEVKLDQGKFAQNRNKFPRNRAILIDNKSRAKATRLILKLKERDFSPRLIRPIEVQKKEEINKTSVMIYFDRYSSFIQAPKTQFIYEKFFFVLFLILFSYTLLCKFSYFEAFKESENQTISEFNYSNKPGSIEKSNSSSGWQEFLLGFWVLTFAFEEILQVLFKEILQVFFFQ